jgi:hypothetical protein
MIIGGTAENENAKGVIQLSEQSTLDTPFPILGIEINTDKSVIKELKKYCKGFFFVRQKRMPLTMCQGIVIGIDNESRTPTLPTIGGVINDINVQSSFVQTENINDINFISEGFLSRYRFKIDKKEDSNGMKILKISALVVAVAAAVVATVFTCGAASVALGAGLGAMLAAGAGAVSTGLLIGVGIGAGAAIAITATAYGIDSGVKRMRQNRNATEAQAIDGRNDPIPDGYERNEQEESRKLIHDIVERYIVKDPTKNSAEAIIVPDYQVNQPYYNQFLTGADFTIKLNFEQPITNYLNDGYFDSNDRHFYVNDYLLQSDNRSYNVKLVGVPDGCPIKMIGNKKYRARAGYAEEAYKYEFIGDSYEDTENKQNNSDIIRGNFGSYVGVNGYTGHACD